jgi:trigger factor
MQVTETLAEGLKREFKVVVPASELDSRLNARLEELKGTASIKGFRPGKVPVKHLRRLVGRQTMSEIVQDILREQSNEILKTRGERAALQPSFDLTEDEKEAERVLDAKADLEFSMRYEVLPKVELGEFKTIAVERPVIEVAEADVDRTMLQLARANSTFTAKKGAAEEGDRVTIDYVGKLGDEPFEGGADNGAQIIIGSKQFIPGFEDQLVGAKPGEKRVIKVTFPQDYGAKNLAGKEANFDVTVHEVWSPDSVAVDDELAQKLGLESVAKLREAVRRQLEGQNTPLIRQRVKRLLLDALDKMHKFEPPPTMVEQEFQSIWQQVLSDLESRNATFESDGTTEEAQRAYYREISDRRVRLGLVLAEIGERNRIDVTEAELQRALGDEIRRNPGREKEITEFYQSNPGAVTQLRAPLFEDKVIDFLMELVDVTDKPMTRQDLIELIESDDAAGEADQAKSG